MVPKAWPDIHPEQTFSRIEVETVNYAHTKATCHDKGRPLMHVEPSLYAYQVREEELASRKLAVRRNAWL
jgi:hypothetical protein